MSRRSHKLEPINIQDFYDHSSLNGLVSFLNVPPRNEPPAPPPVETSPPDVASPDDAASPPDVLPTSRAKRPQRCYIAQDGHSHTEQAVYQVLWEAGTPAENGDRLASLSVAATARRCHIAERNVTVILQRLIGKRALAVESDEQSRQGIARKYRVFSYKHILELRSAAGLEWVVRGRGVDFVDPKTGTLVSLSSPPDAAAPPDAASPAPPDATSGKPPDAASPPSLANISRNSFFRNTTTTAITALQDACERIAPEYRIPGFRLDSDAAKQVDAFGQSHGSEVEETARLFMTGYARLLKKANNPMGVLLKKPEVWINDRELERLRKDAELERKAQEAWEAQMAAELGPDWKTQ
jgi:hypothetical protein